MIGHPARLLLGQQAEVRLDASLFGFVDALNISGKAIAWHLSSLEELL